MPLGRPSRASTLAGNPAGNDSFNSGRTCAALCPREAVMGLVAVDPLAVLPVTAASASAAFARASDPGADETERRHQLSLLQVALAAVRRLLDSCDEEVASLAAGLDSRPGLVPCGGTSSLCRHCLGEPLDSSDVIGRCRRCGRGQTVPAAGAPCSAAGTVVVRDLAGAEQALCVSHAAAAARQIDQLAIVDASRHSRAVLAEVANASCIIGQRANRLARGRDA